MMFDVEDEDYSRRSYRKITTTDRLSISSTIGKAYEGTTQEKTNFIRFEHVREEMRNVFTFLKRVSNGYIIKEGPWNLNDSDDDSDDDDDIENGKFIEVLGRKKMEVVGLDHKFYNYIIVNEIGINLLKCNLLQEMKEGTHYFTRFFINFPFLPILYNNYPRFKALMKHCMHLRN